METTIKREVKEKKWYMVRVATGKEQKAIDNFKFEIGNNGLERYVDEIVIPREKKFYLRNKKKVERDSLMFPGYVLMKMDPIAEIQRIVKSTNLMIEIMGNDKGPEPVKQNEVERIFGNVEKSTTEIEFIQGEPVKIIDGSFKGFNATVQQINKEKKTVKVEVMIFGRPTPVELNYFQIDKE